MKTEKKNELKIVSLESHRFGDINLFVQNNLLITYSILESVLNAENT
jgi:hypothetical protein